MKARIVSLNRTDAIAIVNLGGSSNYEYHVNDFGRAEFYQNLINNSKTDKESFSKFNKALEDGTISSLAISNQDREEAVSQEVGNQQFEIIRQKLKNKKKKDRK